MPSMRSWSEARLLFRSHKRHQLAAAQHFDTILYPGNVCCVDPSTAACYKLKDLSLLVDFRVWTPDSLNPMPSSDSTKLANSIEQLQQFM